MQEYLDVIYYCCIHTDIHILMILASVNMNLFAIILNRPEHPVPREERISLLKEMESQRTRTPESAVGTREHEESSSSWSWGWASRKLRERTQLKAGAGAGQPCCGQPSRRK